jgi:hypothetical protein
MRDAAYNIARWNFFEREIRFVENTWYCNGMPAAVFHMSRLGTNKKSFNRYVKFAPEASRPNVEQLCIMYQNKLRAARFETSEVVRHPFDYFYNGRKIPRISRIAISLVEPDLSEDSNPFSKGSLSSALWWIRIGMLICGRVSKSLLRRILRTARIQSSR